MAATTIPVLPSTDFDATTLFYGKLGFRERGRWPGDYLILANGLGVEVHFWMSPEPQRSRDAAGCYVRFDTAAEVSALHSEWEAAGVGEALRGMVKTDSGLLEFAVLDPDNNQIRFGGPR